MDVEELGSDSHHLAHIGLALADVLLELGQLDEAEARTHRAYTLASSKLDEDHPQLAMYHGGVGRLALARGKFLQARDAFERELACMTAGEQREHTRAWATFNLARAIMGGYQAQIVGFDRAQAMELAIQAQKTAESRGEFGTRLARRIRTWLAALPTRS